MFLVLVSSRSNFLLLMFFGALPSKEILVENTKPCSLGNFLNKVDESLCTPALLFFSCVCFVVNKNQIWFFFFTLLLNMTFCLIWVDCVYIYSMSIRLYTDFDPPSASPHTFDLCKILFLFFRHSSDYVITILQNYVIMFIALKKKKEKNARQVGQTLQNPPDLLEFNLLFTFWRRWLSIVVFEFFCIIWLPSQPRAGFHRQEVRLPVPKPGLNRRPSVGHGPANRKRAKHPGSVPRNRYWTVDSYAFRSRYTF